MTVPSFSSQILNFATSFTTVNLDTKNKVRTELLNIPLIFFISRFVFHGICSLSRSTYLHLFWIHSDMGRLFKEPAMETVKTDLGSHGCNQALMKMRSLVMSRQTGLMAHKQRSATVH